jgi:hypothetical protein
LLPSEVGGEEGLSGGVVAVIMGDRRGGHQRVVGMQDAFVAGVARAAPVGGVIAVSVWSPLSQTRVIPAGGGGSQRVLVDCVDVVGQREPCKAPGRFDWAPDGTRGGLRARSGFGASAQTGFGIARSVDG